MAAPNTAKHTGTVTEALASEIADTPTAAIPSSVQAAVKRLAIDHVGITYMGAALTGKALLAYAKNLGGCPDAVVFGGGGLRVPAELAAGINGQFCRATNFEDAGPGRHLGPLLLHTALAVGQRTHASGRDVLAAMALGYVLSSRFYLARRKGPANATPEHRMVAAGIASRLLGHDQATTARALSLAWEMPHREALPHQLEERGGTKNVPKRVSPLGTPSALATPLFHARAGIQAALMAEYGFDSVPDEIGQYADYYDLEFMRTRPTPFHQVDGQVELKPWSSSRQLQPGLQALVHLMKEHDVDWRAIDVTRLRLPYMSLIPHQIDPTPDNYWQAVYSTNWAVAMLLQRIPAGPKWYTPERLSDPTSRRLAATVEIVEDPEATRLYLDRVRIGRAAIRGTAEIEFGGRTYTAVRTLKETYGSPGMEMTEAMVEDKFLECTSLALDVARARALLDAMRQIDDCSDINRIAALV